jgi:hypothetical protein
MHRSVKTQPNPDLMLASALAKHLLSPSKQFENSALHAKTAAMDGLRCLGTLDKATRLSLPISAPVTAAAPGPQQAPAAAPSLPAVRYDSARTEYKTALRDSTVINALLDYHHHNRAPSGSHAPLAGFRPAPLPVTRAAPKPGATRIFRPRGD